MARARLAADLGRRLLLAQRPRAPRVLNRRITIPARFNGPPASGHGGYCCGLVAERVGADAEVALRRPPPLGRPLEVRGGGDGAVAALAGETVVAEGRPIAPLEIDPPRPVDLDEAAAAAERFEWFDRHPFPTCYGCGTQRAQGDGLRQFTGPVPGRNGVYATPWTPPAELGDRHGRLSALGCWTALDCPSGAAIGAAHPAAPCVLARLAARPIAAVPVGEPHVVMAWFEGRDGRKIRTGAALFSADGEPRAWARALWIELARPR